MIRTKLSPIELIERFIPSLHLEAVPAFREVDHQGDPYEEVSLQNWINIGADDEGNWRVELKVQCWPEPEVKVPYRYKIHLVGIFKVREDAKVPETEMEKLVSCNAPAVLFSWARDVIRAQTSLGPFGPTEPPLCFFAYKEEEPANP